VQAKLSLLTSLAVQVSPNACCLGSLNSNPSSF